MSKHYFLATIASLILGAALVATLFLIMLPQVEPLSSEVVPSYQKIVQQDFAFVEDKHFVTEVLSKKYSIDSTDITTYTNTNQYKPGNYDPFTPKAQLNNSTNNSNQTSAENKTENNNSGSTGSSTVQTGSKK